jgi:hypothetical protein
VVEVQGVQQSSGAAAYDSAVRRLVAGDLDDEVFNRRWAGKSIGGVKLPDARRVRALGRAGEVSFRDFYPRRAAA